MIFVNIICSVLLVTQVFANDVLLYPDECPCVDCYNPVCAKNGEDIQLFASKCTLKLVNSKIIDDCNEKKENNYWHQVADKLCDIDGICTLLCIDLYDPICAYDGTTYETFGNGCELYRANCFNPVWGVYSFGECPTCLPGVTTT